MELSDRISISDLLEEKRQNWPLGACSWVIEIRDYSGKCGRCGWSIEDHEYLNKIYYDD